MDSFTLGGLLKVEQAYDVLIGLESLAAVSPKIRNQYMNGVQCHGRTNASWQNSADYCIAFKGIHTIHM